MLYLLAAIGILYILLFIYRRLSAPTHAGGVVMKKEGATIFYLLITSKNNPAKWVLPKGHIEQGEEEVSAALREVKEEAGIEGRLVQKLGVVHGFKDIIKPIKTVFYLVEYMQAVPSSEGRKQQWLKLDEAIKLAGKPDQQKILQQVKRTVVNTNR